MKFPRPDVVSIVACGPSALKCGAASAPGMVVAVNGAFRYVRHDVALTMDGRFAREEWPKLQGRPFVVRGSAWQHAIDAGAKHWEGVNVYACDNKSTRFATTPEPNTGDMILNGTNSGYVALNFAFNMKPRRVYLYGFDMDEPEHFFGPYPWAGQGCVNSEAKFGAWREEMHAAALQFRAAGIGVFNTNPRSRIREFPYGRPTK